MSCPGKICPMRAESVANPDRSISGLRLVTSHAGKWVGGGREGGAGAAGIGERAVLLPSMPLTLLAPPPPPSPPPLPSPPLPIICPIINSVSLDIRCRRSAVI